MKVPEGWRERKLGELGVIGRGVSYAPDDLSPTDTKDTVRLLRATNIQNGKIITSDLQYVSEGRCTPTQVLKAGDIAICMSSGSRSIVGKSAPFRVADGHRYVVGAFCSVYRPKTSTTGLYLEQYFRSEEYLRALWTRFAGTNINNLRADDIQCIALPLPPLPEQRKIAEILGTWDEAIALVEQRLAAARARKRGLAQRLLTGQVRFPGFTEPWRESTIGDCCDILDSRRVPLNAATRAEMQGDIPYWGANGVVDYVNDYLFDEPLLLIPEDGGYFGQAESRPICFLLDGKAWVNNHAHVLHTREIALRLWVYYWFVHRNIVPYINAGTRDKLNQNDLRKLPLRLPTLAEQARVTTVLTAADSAISVQRTKLAALQGQKKGLMQRLLTGEVRVRV